VLVNIEATGYVLTRYNIPTNTPTETTTLQSRKRLPDRLFQPKNPMMRQ